MSPRDFFFAPGRWIVDGFMQWILEVPPHVLEPELHNITAFIIAAFFWIMVIRVTVAIIKKLFGFEQRWQ